MKVVAVYKWARDPEDATVRDDGSVDWRGAKRVPGDDDAAVVATSRELAAATGGSAIGLTIGDGDATWALARGLEQAVSVPDAPESMDEAVTARILATAVRSIGDVDVLVIGDAQANPGVAPALAGELGWPALLGVTSAGVAGGRVTATRRVGDREQVLSAAPQLVLGVAAAAAEKQPPGIKDVLAARKRPVVTCSVGEFGVIEPERLQTRGRRAPDSAPGRIFTGEDAAADLVAALRADGVL